MSMIFEWVATWIATKTAGFLVKTIINEEFVKDFVKDYTKDFFKNTFNIALTERFKQEPLQKAAVMAVTEYLELMQQDLDDSELPEDEIKKYTPRLKQFLKNSQVKEILGNAFQNDCQTVDTKRLEEIWYELNSSYPLPDDFNWKRVCKKYVQKVKNIIHELPELREIFDSKNIEQTKEYTKEIAGIIPEFDLQHYQESIRERYGNLKLDSLDTSGYAYNELKLWRMFVTQNVREVHQVLPQIYELPKEHLRRLRESDQLEAEIQAEELERYKRVYLEQPIRSVLDIVNDRQTYKYIVILGDPGSGKSTLLQYLALNWAESPLDNVISLPIPLLIELRTYMRRRDDKECHNFLEFFHKCSGVVTHLNQHKLHEQLKAGNAVVMFDGLDEVFDPGKREDVITDIHRFTNDYPNVQVIVTSRKIGYKLQRLRDAEFHHFELQDLDSEQIQDFIHRWHELTFSDEADKVRKRERLQRGIENSKAITELAGNPLLLTMMAILNRNQELPRDRATLYEQASRVLLHQWDVERALVEDERLDHKTIDYKDKQAMLRQVAYSMQTSDKGLAGNLISANQLENILTEYLRTIEINQPRQAAKVMINQLRTRNFMLCFLGADYYAFVHQTFLEYFCAWEFVWQFKESQTLSIEKLKHDVFGKHWHDESWHEVLLLIAGMIEPKFVGEILDYLMALDGEGEKYINLFLAAKCLAEVRNRSVIASTSNELLKRIKKLIHYGDNHTLIKQDNYEQVSQIRMKAVITVVTNWKVDSDTLPWIKKTSLQNDNKLVRYATVRVLSQKWKNEPDIQRILKACVTQDDDEIVRSAAIQELARGWKDDPNLKAWLKNNAINNEHWDVRQTSVEELARGWKDEPETKFYLKQLTNQDDPFVQTTAVEELARLYRNDSEVKLLLKQIATENKDVYVRLVAVEELARSWKDEPDIEPILKAILKSRNILDDNKTIQAIMFPKLVFELQNQRKTTFDILCDIIIKKSLLYSNSSETNSRQTALELIIWLYPYHPQTLPLLRDRAENDPDEQVREYAQKQLKQWEG